MTLPTTHDLKWPELTHQHSEDTQYKLMLICQIIGKIKLRLCPFINHWWHITFQPTTSGLSTGIMSAKGIFFEINLNLISHEIEIKLDNGKFAAIDVSNDTISIIYYKIFDVFKTYNIELEIWTVPVEIENRTPFDKDKVDRKYNKDYATNYWKALLLAYQTLCLFRTIFMGKSSPVHFFWGSMDLAVTFFTGRPAPVHPGVPNVGKMVMQEAYSAELASFGFWCSGKADEAAFYSYTYPANDKYRTQPIKPSGAIFSETLGEFIFPYNAFRNSPDSTELVLAFLNSAFDAAINTTEWDESLLNKSKNERLIYEK